ncbi:MAG: sterol desaturase family protein [Hyphomonadaceae bacterium]|nr:sterol desaturase family protein [Hyphomonadaceae bacterium]
MHLYDFAHQWLINVQTDLGRYVIFAVSVWFVLWVALARPLAGRKIRPDTPKPKQLLIEFAASLRSIAIFSTIGLFTFALEKLGWLPGPAIAQSWGAPWFALSLVLMIVGHDAYFYWTHRLMHDPRLFRVFHRRHHRSHNPSPFTAYSFDVGEAAVMGAFVPLWMMIVPTQWPVVGLFMLHQIVRNTLGHSGYELFPAGRDGRPLFDFLTTTTHHDLHHQAGYNYGLYFTWWDRMMGTEHPDYYARFAAATRKPLLPAKAPVIAAIALACLIGFAPQARAAARPDLNGDWATPGLGAVVRLAPCADNAAQLCGSLIWAWDPGRLRHGQIGMLMLRGFSWDGDAYTNGALTNPEDGRTYRGAIRPDGDVLRLQGCAGPFCQTQVWRRLNSIPRP